MKTVIIRIILLTLIILNCLTIFVFSSEIDVDSSSRSGRVADFIVETIPSLRNMSDIEKETLKSEVLQPIVRKLAHLTIYTTLGMFSMSLALTYKGTHYQKGLSSFVFCLLYSISDEIHQLYVPGRSGEVRDVFIDILGALIGILLITFIAKIYRKIKKLDEKEKDINKDTKNIIYIKYRRTFYRTFKTNTFNGKMYLSYSNRKN